MTRLEPRPWYIFDDACDEWVAVLSNGGDFPVLKSLKIIRSIVVNIGVIAMSLYMVSKGGDPTVLGTLSLLLLGGYNGLEFSDYLALLQAYNEVQNDE